MTKLVGDLAWTNVYKAMCGRQLLTVPKKNASISISFLPTICRFAKVCYFYVGKKEYSISATNKHLCW